MQYWLHGDSSHVAAEMRRRIDLYAERMNQLGRSDIWRRMSALLSSRDSDSNLAATDVRTGGLRGEMIGTRVNYIGRYYRAVDVMVTGSRPSYQARSIASSAEAISQVSVANAVCDYVISKRGAEDATRRALQYMLAYGEGWVSTLWDERSGRAVGTDEQGRERREGDIKITAKRPDEVVRDVDLDECTENDWIIVARQASRWRLAQQHPELAEYIGNARTWTNLETIRDSLRIIRGTQSRQSVGDTVTVYDLYAPPTPMLPEGRFGTLLGDRLIADDIAQYDDLAHYPMIAAVEPGTPWGHSYMWDLCGPQQVVDALTSAMLSTVHNYGRPTLFVPEGSVLDTSKEAMLLPYRVVRGSAAPSMITMDGNVLAPLFAAKDDLVDGMTQITGLNDAALGDASKSQSGTALATMHTMAQQSVSGAQSAYSTGFGKTMFGAVKLFRQFATDERLIHVAGSQYAGDVARFKGGDLWSIEGIDTEMGPAATRHSTGKREFADKMWQMGAIKSPQEYLEAQATGRTEPILDRPRSQRRLVEEENKRLREGKPIAVDPLDDHRMHIQGHACVGDDSELRAPVLDAQGAPIMEPQVDPATGMVVAMVPVRNPILVARDEHIAGHVAALRSMDPDLASALMTEPVPGQVMAQQMGGQMQQAAPQGEPQEEPEMGSLEGTMPVTGVPQTGNNVAPVAKSAIPVA